MKLFEKVKGLVERVRSAQLRGAPIIGSPHDGGPIPAISWWGHMSNDNYAPGEEGTGKDASRHPFFAGRAWMHFGTRVVDAMCIDTQWQIGKRATLCLASLNVNPVEGGVGLSLALPRVFYFHVGLDGWPKEFYQRLGVWKDYEPRSVEVSFHDNTVWWRLWSPTMKWSNQTPRWREGNVAPADVAFGDMKMTERVIRKTRVEIPMPEGTYPATITMSSRVWKRPRARWVSHEGVYANIEVDKPGIPIPGKGTASYNCGPDATFSLSLPAKNEEKAIGHLVSSILARRARYGSGHRDVPVLN